ncbi:MAG: methyltransferase domain-containing protein, partial [Thermodesulfobacteriota bacterium]|nr:methyltransferase domain-containing protein [Thermodesulfobacteriota bacterium]
MMIDKGSRFFNFGTKYDIEKANIENISNSSIATEYFDWQIRNFHPYLSGRVLEIGAGIGTISQRLAKLADTLVISDISDQCIEIVRNRMKTENYTINIEYINYSLGAPTPDLFCHNPFDSIVCVNVLEHVEDDVMALRYLLEALSQKGRLLLLVPALKFLYGSTDRALGHYRRYKKKSISEKLYRAGYEIEKIKYINFIGVFGWWFNCRVLKREIIPLSTFRIFRCLFPF